MINQVVDWIHLRMNYWNVKYSSFAPSAFHPRHRHIPVFCVTYM